MGRETKRLRGEGIKFERETETHIKLLPLFLFRLKLDVRKWCKT